MKLFYKKSLIIITISLGVLVVASVLSAVVINQKIIDQVGNGFRSKNTPGKNTTAVFWNTSNNYNPATVASTITQIGTCIVNSTNVDYFVPTRTKGEWNSFVSAINKKSVTGLSLSDFCPGNGQCNTVVGENCANSLGDCGSCGSPCPSSISYGGESYGVVQIGSQCWLDRDLNVGTEISKNSNPTNNGVIEKYCIGEGISSCSGLSKRGIYTKSEAMAWGSKGLQGICPSGWHVPTMSDFQTLSNFYGGNSVAGGYLKIQFSCNTTSDAIICTANHNLDNCWQSPNPFFIHGPFLARPSFIYTVPASLTSCANIGKNSGYWVSNADNVMWTLSHSNTIFEPKPVPSPTYYNNYQYSLPVRCVRDEPAIRFYAIFDAGDYGTVKTNSVAATSSITQIIYGTGKNTEAVTVTPFSGYTFDSWEIISPTPSIKRTNPWTISNINDHYYAIAQYKDSSSGGSGSSEEGVCAVRGTLPIHGFDGRIPDPTFGDYCGSLGVTQCLNSPGCVWLFQ
jgi:uncharacterized protein (TIGR02145 family)